MTKPPTDIAPIPTEQHALTRIDHYIRDEGGVLVVNSRAVAKQSDKRHDHVLRDIDVLLDSPELDRLTTQRAALFRPKVIYDEASRKDGRTFDITEQGFELLGMYWSGTKARRFMIANISAFRRVKAAPTAQKEVASTVDAGEPVAKPVAPMTPTVVEGELRIRDIDLGERLGFSAPIDIRKLVRRHQAALSALGTLATVATVKRGQQTTEFYLNRKQAIFITAKSETEEATDITIEIIEKFDAYERGATASLSDVPHYDFSTYDGLLRASTVMAQGLIAATQKLEEANQRAGAAIAEVDKLAPKAAALDRIADMKGDATIGTTAKELDMKPGDLFLWLKVKKWIFRASGSVGAWCPYQTKITAGYLTVHETPDPSGAEWTHPRIFITPKGRARLAELNPKQDMVDGVVDEDFDEATLTPEEKMARKWKLLKFLRECGATIDGRATYQFLRRKSAEMILAMDPGETDEPTTTDGKLDIT